MPKVTYIEFDGETHTVAGSRRPTRSTA